MAETPQRSVPTPHRHVGPVSPEDRLARAVADEVTLRLQAQLSRMESRLDAMLGDTTEGVVANPEPSSHKVVDEHAPAAESGSEVQDSSARALMMGGSERDKLLTEEETESEEESTIEVQKPKKTFWQRYKDCKNLQPPVLTGPLVDLVESSRFQNASFLVVILNTVFIWYLADYDSQRMTTHHPHTMQMIECAFLGYYTVELILRICVHRLWFFWNDDAGWNIFDFTIVAAGLVEFIGRKVLNMKAGFNPSFLRVSRLLRVVRVLRILKTVRFLDDLQIMVQCIIGCMESLFWAILLMSIILMISAIILVQNMTAYKVDNPSSYCDNEHECEDINNYFGTVYLCMFALFQVTTGGLGWGDVLPRVQLAGGLATAFYVFCITFFQFAFFNIVTSIFVDKGLKLAKPDVEALTRMRREEEHEMAMELGVLFVMLDKDGSGHITVGEIKEASTDPEVFHRFELLGITVRDVDTFFGTLMAMTPDGELDKDDFVQGCLKMAGPASSLVSLAILQQVKSLSTPRRGLMRPGV